MSVETVRDAMIAGWTAKARCQGKRREKIRDTRDCALIADLDMVTLGLTKGPNFPLSLLSSRLMCPRCGGRNVVVMFDVPRQRQSA